MDVFAEPGERLRAASPDASMPGAWSRQQAVDCLLVALAWATIAVSAAVLPVDDLGGRTTALFLHLIFVPVAFGAVVMSHVYLVRCRSGRPPPFDVRALTGVTHTLMATGLAGLATTGIALDPDVSSPLMRGKLVLLLVLMLSAVRVQQSHRRIVGPVLVSQVAWWGTIGIGFLVTTAR